MILWNGLKPVGYEVAKALRKYYENSNCEVIVELIYNPFWKIPKGYKGILIDIGEKNQPALYYLIKEN